MNSGGSNVNRNDLNSSQGKFRIYNGPEGESPEPQKKETPARAANVTIPAGELVTLLREAVNENRAWLQDFQDDQITLTADLYEVLLAHRKLRRPSA